MLPALRPGVCLQKAVLDLNPGKNDPWRVGSRQGWKGCRIFRASTTNLHGVFFESAQLISSDLGGVRGHWTLQGLVPDLIFMNMRRKGAYKVRQRV